MGDTDVVDQLLAAIRARDLEQLATCFAPHAKLRALTPHELREENGPEQIVGRYRAWLASLEPFAVTDADVVQIADRVRLRYRFHGRDPVKGWQVNEHTAYAAVVDGRIVTLNLSCAGFRPAEPQG